MKITATIPEEKGPPREEIRRSAWHVRCRAGTSSCVVAEVNMNKIDDGRPLEIRDIMAFEAPMRLKKNELTIAFPGRKYASTLNVDFDSGIVVYNSSSKGGDVEHGVGNCKGDA